MRRHLTYANLVSTVCLVLVLGGGAFAAATITGKDVKNSSLTGKDVKNSSLKGKDVRDASLTGADVGDGSLGVADLGGALLPGARIEAQGTFAVPNGATNPVNMTLEDYDTGNMATAGVDHLTITRAGTYAITGFIGWSGSASATARQVRIVVDDVNPSRAFAVSAAQPEIFTQEVSTVEYLTVGQRVSLGLFSGAAGNVGTAPFTPPLPSAALTVQMVSP